MSLDFVLINLLCPRCLETPKESAAPNEVKNFKIVNKTKQPCLYHYTIQQELKEDEEPCICNEEGTQCIVCDNPLEYVENSSKTKCKKSDTEECKWQEFIYQFPGLKKDRFYETSIGLITHKILLILLKKIQKLQPYNRRKS